MLKNIFKTKIINIRGTILEDECVGEEEESLIQSFICDETEAGISHQYSSRNDPYGGSIPWKTLLTKDITTFV